MILATEEDVISMYPTSKIDHQRNAKKYYEAMELRSNFGYGSLRISRKINMPLGAVHHWLFGGMPKSIKGIKELKSMDLLPLRISNSLAFQQFIITLGFRYADGCIYEQKRNRSITIYVCFGKEIDALKFCEDVKKAWKLTLAPHLEGIYYVYLPASLGRLMMYIGSPSGNKNYQNFRLPKWIFNLNDSLKWKFIDGLFSGDGASPKLKRSKNSCESLKFTLNAEENIVKEFCFGFMKDIKNLISSLGVNVTEPKIEWNSPLISKKGIITYTINIRILTKKDNIIKFLENVPYSYRKNAKIEEVLNALKYKNRIKELKEYIKNVNDSYLPEICVLLKKDLQEKLIINAATNIANSKWGRYKKLAYHLKNKCKTFDLINASSIFDVYIPLWKKNKKFIPIDCMVELFKLNNLNISDLENNIEKIKTLKTNNKNAINY